MIQSTSASGEIPMPLALSMGEPAGISGEISLKAWLRRDVLETTFFIIDDPNRLADLSQNLGLDVPIEIIDMPSQAPPVFNHRLPVLPLDKSIRSILGSPSIDTADSVIESIEKAVFLTQSGEAAGVVTNPIQKAALYDAGFSHPGHTELLAELSGLKSSPIMMIAGQNLRVVPVTIHVSLRQALEQLNTSKIIHATQITYQALKTEFGISQPRIAITALNPHAGEGGAMGDEEQTIIQPAIASLLKKGIQVTGPLPSDTLFSPEQRQTYDAAICMYHDQALIPIKALEFNQAVNVTLGLPFVRTSPDHGTALDIAKLGKANPSSLISSLNLAAKIAARRKKIC
jgi:4-hydroxythreonine-4-phosphate dehydrogenase